MTPLRTRLAFRGAADRTAKAMALGTLDTAAAMIAAAIEALTDEHGADGMALARQVFADEAAAKAEALSVRR